MTIKKKIFCVFLSVLFVFASACYSDNNREEETRMFELLVLEKFDYSIWMNFRLRYNKEEFSFYRFGSPEYEFTDIVFVATEDEAANYGGEVLVAYPGRRTEIILENLNSYIEKAEEVYHDEIVDISEFSLAFPITMTDLVEKWENVYQLMKSFSEASRHLISTYVSTEDRTRLSAGE
jgi:hypothetical protein